MRRGKTCCYELRDRTRPGRPAKTSWRRGRGWSTGCSAICWSMSPATPIAPKSASISSISPDSATGRLGLVEFRSFEMPPDARMSLAQQFLLRALIAWFWREPLRRARWCVGAPRCTTVSCCRISSGRTSSTCSPISPARATPSIRYGSRRSANSAFRCLARVTHGGVDLELRQALEPWHVLGEEDRRGGTVRFVDSSVERLQVKAKGLVAEPPCRHLQRPPPADDRHRHGRRGASPASASRRGSRLPALHPTIPSHAPLTFDILDGWSGRSLGGCVYHVAHPGGRNYETFPVNSYEAEARRPRAVPGLRPYAGLRAKNAAA